MQHRGLNKLSTGNVLSFRISGCLADMLRHGSSCSASSHCLGRGSLRAKTPVAWALIRGRTLRYQMHDKVMQSISSQYFVAGCPLTLLSHC